VKYDVNPGAEGFQVRKPTKAKKGEKYFTEIFRINVCFLSTSL